MLLYKTTDKIEVKIGKITFKISPLSHAHKSELQEHMTKAANGDISQAMVSVRKAIKYCVKDMKGVQHIDDNNDVVDYLLEFDDNGLTEQCLDDILNLPLSNDLSSVCAAFLGGVPNKIVDNEGKEVEGISIVQRKVSGKKK